MADNLIIAFNNQYSNLIDSIGEILQKSKQQIATSVNTILVESFTLYFKKVRQCLTF